MKENQELEEPNGLSNESIEKALGASLTLLFVLATADLLMYHFAGTAALTIIAHILSLLLYLKHQLRLDLVKILEMVALVIDGVLIVKKGYALACPVSTLIVIIYIGLNRERQLLQMKEDLQKVFAAKQK